MKIPSRIPHIKGSHLLLAAMLSSLSIHATLRAQELINVTPSHPSATEQNGALISVTSPPYCSDIRGDTRIMIVAPGLSGVTVKCWKQGMTNSPKDFGSDSIVGHVTLDHDGKGSITFPANQYPHGPITVRISGEKGPKKDNCYLQLYNKGGVSWKEGIPKDPPPAAQGMKLVFQDDFDKKLSISGTDNKATYYDHKPPTGAEDFSSIPFVSFEKPNNPFSQVDGYLRIRASEKVHSTGLISSVKPDASGVTAKVPCYFECRFIAPNSVGSWPAFWLLTDYITPLVKQGIHPPCDELDIIEAVGGEGPHSPNAFELFQITPHAWAQGAEGDAIGNAGYKAMNNPIKPSKHGITSTWYESFHIYGCKITEEDTIYYMDNIELGRHKTFPVSKKTPFFFLINLATGSGWPVDFSRYDGICDMYVDYVRVYQGQ